MTESNHSMDLPNPFASVDDFVGRYSELHDAEIVTLTVDAVRMSVALRFTAEEYETGEFHSIDVVMERVSRFCFNPGPSAGQEFSDYRFPANRLVERAEIDGVLKRISVDGMYGWRLEICGDSINAIRVVEDGTQNV